MTLRKSERLSISGMLIINPIQTYWSEYPYSQRYTMTFSTTTGQSKDWKYVADQIVGLHSTRFRYPADERPSHLDRMTTLRMLSTIPGLSTMELSCFKTALRQCQPKLSQEKLCLKNIRVVCSAPKLVYGSKKGTQDYQISDLIDKSIMSALPSTADLIGRHSEYATKHEPIATFQERVQAGQKLPNVAIITCADPRCIPEDFLKLRTWDAIVIRTAGSNVKAALPSLVAIDELVKLREIMVINHTDCGALAFRDDAIRRALTERAPSMSAHIESMEFGQITGYVADSWIKVLLLIINQVTGRPCS